MELNLAATFDIKDTWLFMGLLAQREESEVARYIREKKKKELLSARDIAEIEYASEIRSTLRETKQICSRKAFQEKSGQYQQEALERLLEWGVISSDEVKVLHLRAKYTYREIGKALNISASTAYNTVERVHERVKKLYNRIAKIDLSDSCDVEQLKANAETVASRLIEIKLSNQQAEIYRLINKGYSDNEICLIMGISSGSYRVQKCRLNKAINNVRKL